MPQRETTAFTQAAPPRRSTPRAAGPAPLPAALHPAIGFLPQGLFLMSTAFEGRRAGALAHSVQACGDGPTLLCVTIRQGHWVEPLIRDSHAFSICILDPADRLPLRKFVEPGRPKEPGDPFDCLQVETLTTGSPVLKRAIAALDCEVVRHLDLNMEHSLYVGAVVASRVYQPQAAIASPRIEPGRTA